MPLNNKKMPQRLSGILEKMSVCKIDGLIICNMSTVRYLCGFTGSEGLLFVGPKKPVLFVDGRYTTQAGMETEGIKIIECADRIEAVALMTRQLKLKHIGFEADFVTWSLHNKLTAQAPETKFTPWTDELKTIRAIKDDDEIMIMKKAAEISSAAIQSVVNRITPGWTEKATAWQLEIAARENGADGIAFETIVASGENSSLPHAKPGKRKIRKGDFVVIDFGVRYQGYCSDETCTLAFGKLTDRQKNAYQVVKDAHDRALELLRADIPGAAIDQHVRSVFGKNYVRYFTHGTGHGVGLEVHEAPRLSSLSDDILKPRMVFTVEPGLYLPGRWGVRIEDTVLLKENSCEKLTKMDKRLTIIE